MRRHTVGHSGQQVFTLQGLKKSHESYDVMLIPGQRGLECQAKELGLHSVGSRQSFEKGSDAELYHR